MDVSPGLKHCLDNVCVAAQCCHTQRVIFS